MLASTLVERRAGPSIEQQRGFAIRIERLHKRFANRRSWPELARRAPVRHTTAVDQISLDIGLGEIVGLLGTNGAGKTTLLKMLSTLIVPDSGRATVLGADVVREPDRVRRVLTTVAPDERSLDWRLNARENLRFFAALYGLKGPALMTTIENALASVDLTDTGSKLVGAFSSGMRQRLLVARALLAQPRILLLDEPTRSLDPLAARTFRHFVREQLVGKHECTILLATHDADEALELCDRIAILHHGRLLEVGSPAELQDQFGGDRFRVWTSTPEHGLFAARGAKPVPPQNGDDANGWTVLELELPLRNQGSAELLKQLVDCGVNVARFEKVKPNLAEVIESVIRERGNAAHV